MPDRTTETALTPMADTSEPVAERVARHVADGGHLLELVNAKAGGALSRQLGQACREFPGGLFVWQIDDTAEQRVPAEVFFAFGFRRLFSCVEGCQQHVLHEYRLAEYKSPPDWLNARYWANPERFDADPDEVRQLPATDDAPDSWS